jgi:hypothetical protein
MGVKEIRVSCLPVIRKPSNGEGVFFLPDGGVKGCLW